jgi:hypothetical protein
MVMHLICDRKMWKSWVSKIRGKNCLAKRNRKSKDLRKRKRYQIFEKKIFLLRSRKREKARGTIAKLWVTLFFCGNGVCMQGLHLESLHQPFFQDRVS